MYQKPNDARMVLLMSPKKLLERFGKIMAQRMSAAISTLAVIVISLAKPP